MAEEYGVEQVIYALARGIGRAISVKFAELGASVILGCDAHTPEHVADPNNLRDAEAFAARFQITPLEDISLKKPV